MRGSPQPGRVRDRTLSQRVVPTFRPGPHHRSIRRTGGCAAIGHPGGRTGLLARVAPFAGIAILAEASLALPPGWGSDTDAILSLVLLLAASAAIAFLPWLRLPDWLAMTVPLA